MRKKRAHEVFLLQRKKNIGLANLSCKRLLIFCETLCKNVCCTPFIFFRNNIYIMALIEKVIEFVTKKLSKEINEENQILMNFILILKIKFIGTF